MKIQIRQTASCAKVVIEAGDYLVAAKPEQSMLQLTGRGKEFLIPAVKRPNRGKSKITSVQFYSLGGGQWTLVVSLPNRGELVSFIQYEGTGGVTAGGGATGNADGGQISRGIADSAEDDDRIVIPDAEPKKPKKSK